MAQILEKCPLETVERLMKVLQEVQEYNNMQGFRDMMTSEVIGSDQLAKLSYLADVAFMAKIRENARNIKVQ